MFLVIFLLEPRRNIIFDSSPYGLWGCKHFIRFYLKNQHNNRYYDKDTLMSLNSYLPKDTFLIFVASIIENELILLTLQGISRYESLLVLLDIHSIFNRCFYFRFTSRIDMFSVTILLMIKNCLLKAWIIFSKT